MSEHGNHHHLSGHHHHPDHIHPPASVQPSILRLSGSQRLGFAMALIALLWLAVIWAMR